MKSGTKFIITLSLFCFSMKQCSSFSPHKRLSRTAARPLTPLRYTVIAGLEDEEEEVDPWSVGAASESLHANANTAYAKAINGGPGDLSGYSDDYVEEEVEDLNVDAFKSEVGGIMPGFRLSALCGDD